MQEKDIQLIFDPGKGSVGLRRMTAVCGDRVGSMPVPERGGYVFDGWYTTPDGDDTGTRITAETVVRDEAGGELMLYAHWSKPTRQAKKRSSLGTQKKAIWALVITALVLIVGLIVTNIVIDIYRFEDVDGTVYTIKKKKGVYGLYHKGGDPCDVNDDGYWLTTFGTQLELDGETGEYSIYAVVDTEGTEVVGNGQRVLMFKQLTYDKSSTKDYTRVIDRIEIHNQYGETVLYRGDDSSNRFSIEGHEGTLFSDELFAQLSVGCGYTISMMRLENPVRLPDGSIDYAEYGLAPETRTKLDEDGKELLDEDGNPVTYDYTPSWYVISTLLPDARTGLDHYRVTLGDATVSGAGYYARYEDRDTVYVLSSVNLDAAVLQPIETLVTPMLVYPMTLNSYFNVDNFVLRANIDYEQLYLRMFAAIAGVSFDEIDVEHPENIPQEIRDKLKAAEEALAELKDEDFEKLYDKALRESSDVITAFSFIPMETRETGLYAALPYRMATDYMAGYLPNSNNISMVLQNLYNMTFNGVIALGPTEDELEAYGLNEPAFVISFLYHDTEGQDHSNEFFISAKTEDGTYYGFSPAFDMIVSIPESSLSFLEWEEIDWYEREYYQYNIAYLQSIRLEGASVAALDPSYRMPDGSILFTVDNSASDQSSGINSDKLKVYINGSTKPADYTLTVTKPSGSTAEETATYNFRRFVQSLLTASVEGYAGLSEDEMTAFTETPDTACNLKITIILNDGQGNTENLVYRFYQYTERRAFMTVESLATPDAPSAPQNGQGKFCVLRSFCDKLVTDAARFIAGQEITPESKN